MGAVPLPAPLRLLQGASFPRFAAGRPCRMASAVFEAEVGLSQGTARHEHKTGPFPPPLRPPPAAAA